MSDPLFVDTSRLELAAEVVRNLVLPAAPTPITAPGDDTVSEAINELLPDIERPVVDALPSLQEALSRTAANLAAAAGIYAQADQALGDTMSRAASALGDVADSDVEQTSAVLSPREAMTRLASDATPVVSTAEATTSRLAEAISDLTDAPSAVSEVTTSVGEMSGAVNTVMSTVQSMIAGSQGFATSAQPQRNLDETPDNDAADAEETEETTDEDEPSTVAAAAGPATGEAAPVEMTHVTSSSSIATAGVDS